MLASAIANNATRIFKDRWVFSFCLVLIASSGCGSQNEHVTLGRAALDKKAYATAVEHFSEAISADQRSFSAYIGRGQAHESLGEFTAAINDYEKVLALSPTHPQANERLGYVFLESGDGYKAREQFAKLKKQLPPQEYLLAMARAELLCGEAKQALEHLDRLLASEPNNIRGLYFRGAAHASLGQLEAANNDFTKTIDLAPEMASAYWRRAVVRDRLQKSTLAEADRKKATKLDPTHAFAESELGKNLLESLKGSGSEAGAISLQPLRSK